MTPAPAGASPAARMLRGAASTAQIATACGVADTTVQRWRNGSMTPAVEMREKLLGLYGIEPALWELPAVEPVPGEAAPLGSSRDEVEAHVVACKARRIAATTASEQDKADKALQAALSLRAKLDGALASATDESRLAQSPKFNAVLAVIVTALAPYPEAAAAVAAALRAFNAGVENAP